MLHPNQFTVNEAWIVFKLNDVPVHTEQDGDFDFIALMDAANGFILSTLPIPAQAAELTTMDAKRVLKEAKSSVSALPKTLFIPTDQPAQTLENEATHQGITVVRVPEDQLMHFIGEAREGFRARFGRKA